MSQYGNTLHTVLKLELALTDAPASHHSSSSYLW